ncbi:hypothetical protein BRD11_04855 [Halobacteriales archaeon SW_12_69_24]|nr:MAG: hypothetical protein BRD11_04855 [Halobacteriales archaeon SW_12_69_24]
MIPTGGTVVPVAVPFGVASLPLQAGPIDFGIVLLMFLVGLFVIYKGFDEYRVSRLIRDTATERVRSVAVGRTELAQPFTDGEYLHAMYRVEEYRESDDGSDWHSVAFDVWVAPFLLADDTGRIRVEPTATAKFEISEENTTEITVPAGRSPPAGVGEFLESVDGVGPDLDERRRYTQEVIPTGSSVYVLGGAEQRDVEEGGNEDRLVVRRDDGSDRFVVSDMAEDELASGLGRRAPLLILFGLVFSTVCLYIMLDMLAPNEPSAGPARAPPRPTGPQTPSWSSRRNSTPTPARRRTAPPGSWWTRRRCPPTGCRMATRWRPTPRRCCRSRSPSTPAARRRRTWPGRRTAPSTRPHGSVACWRRPASSRTPSPTCTGSGS